MDVGLVVIARAQTLERGFLVAECSKECVRKLRGIEGLKGQFRYGLFNFYSIHEF